MHIWNNDIELSHSAAVDSEAGGMPAHAQRVLSSLNQQRAVGRFCDAVISVGGGVVYLAHRSILACFSELLQQSNLPAVPCMELCLQECPKEGLELLLNFVYTGELKLDCDNLDKVQHAATSLCIPEALALCQRFKETSVDPGPFKRKRGRPRKTASETSLHCPVKEENSLPVTKDELNLGSATVSFSLAPTTTNTGITTTTRSGRVVKGPRRLVTAESPTCDFTATETNSTRVVDISGEKENRDAVVHSLAPDQPAGERKVKGMTV